MIRDIKWRQAIPGVLLAAVLALLPGSPGQVRAQDLSLPPVLENMEINGFTELRAGYRTGSDDAEEDLSVMDARLQVEAFTFTDEVDFKYKADVWGDGITDQGEYDTREAWIFTRAFGGVDLKIGRQVLTWGTGDLVFLNDLFPKDWQSFFIGRDDEYLKAPSDAVKCSFFTDIASVDLVFTPRFDPDRYITGEYLSHWNGDAGRITGRDEIKGVDRPDDWFDDHEIALRIYRNINNYEVALYGYTGFWKNPSGRDAQGRGIFPALSVYGASIRAGSGPVSATSNLPGMIPGMTGTAPTPGWTTPRCGIWRAIPRTWHRISTSASSIMWSRSWITTGMNRAWTPPLPGTGSAT